VELRVVPSNPAEKSGDPGDIASLSLVGTQSEEPCFFSMTLA
jgi:hypothetical protein